MVFIVGNVITTGTLKSVWCFLPLFLIPRTVFHPVSNFHRQCLKCNQLILVSVFIKGIVFNSFSREKILNIQYCNLIPTQSSTINHYYKEKKKILFWCSKITSIIWFLIKLFYVLVCLNRTISTKLVQNSV